LAYFSTSGLTAGMTHVGTILPAGLATDAIAFSYPPLGGATTVVPVIIVPIPEPSTLAMLAVVGLIGIFRRRRKA